MTDKIRVVELFAGVGGFRLGLEGRKDDHGDQYRSASSGYEKPFESPFRVVWSNQWEPSTKAQHASDVYVSRFGSEGHFNLDIAAVSPWIPEGIDLLVGGFPCQDYSVARTLNQAEGLAGKKGVLWWEIYRILKESPKKPKVLFLENVDRLLKSPAHQRGRDFAVMLRSLAQLGYTVEWRVINAAEYGMPQRRRRVFILAYHQDTGVPGEVGNPSEWILSNGVFAESFPVARSDKPFELNFELDGELDDISDSFPMSVYDADETGSKAADLSPFVNSGVMVGKQVTTIRTSPKFEGKSAQVLRDIVYLNGDREIDSSYFLESYSLETWEYLKGAKKDNPRTSKSGFKYHYNEGPMSFPDPLEKPSRTIITAEGGSTPSRFKHVIDVGNKSKNETKLRRLIPEELEKLNMFPPGHTEMDGISDIKRAFFMGNALVVGIVERVAEVLGRRWRS